MINPARGSAGAL